MSDYFKEMGETAKLNNQLDTKYYHIFKVKRGLRNADGSGVLVGLTNVSSVIGYVKEDEEVKPVNGKLYYRGFDVQDLVQGIEKEKRYGFEEIVFLLLFGMLPSQERLDAFTEKLSELRELPINFTRDILQTFRTRDIMNALSRSVLTLYSMDEEAEDLAVHNQVRQAMSLVAKITTLVPYAYYAIQQAFYNKSLILHMPDTKLSMAEHFLHLLRPTSEFSELEAKTLDIAMILHADHGGGNNSTFTTRVVSSTKTDFYSAMAASLGSLKGPLHGGANARIMGMMDDLKKSVKNPNSDDELREYMFKLLRGEAYDGGGKIYGVGHAVYTLSDPRATVLREYARKLAKEKDRQEEFALFERVERLGPDVLREFKNNPNMPVSSNVDFYSGFVYDCLGIPREVYTPIFAMSRMAGWAAHRLEVVSNADRLMRPAYKSLGGHCQYIPMTERDGSVFCPTDPERDLRKGA